MKSTSADSGSGHRVALPILIILAVVGIGLAGGYLVHYATHWGPWAHSDSVEYFEAAHNWSIGAGPVLIREDGSVHPIYLRPPLYPVVLGSLSALGMTLKTAASGLDIALFFGFICVVGIGVYWISRSVVLALSACILAVCSPTMLQDFTGAMSEPLFYFLGFASLIVLLLYKPAQQPGEGKKPNAGGSSAWFLLSALLAGGAFMARYSGIAFVLTGTVAVFILHQAPETAAQPSLARPASAWQSLRRKSWTALVGRLAWAAGYALIGLGPFILWTLYLRGQGETPGIYGVVGATLTADLKQVAVAVIQAVWSWIPYASKFNFLSLSSKAVILLLGCVAMAVLVLLTVRWPFKARKLGPTITRSISKKPEWTSLPALKVGLLFSLFAVSYISFLAVSYILVKAPKPALNDRILSPLLLAGFLGVTGLWNGSLVGLKSATGRLARTPSSLATVLLQIGQLLPLIIALLAIRVNRPPLREFLTLMYNDGVGYTSRIWQYSPTVAALRSIPGDTPIVSTDIDAVMFFLNRPAFKVPSWNIEAHALRLVADDSGDKAVLVIFNATLPQFENQYGPQAKEQLQAFTNGLTVYFSGVDGSIYYAGLQTGP